MAVLFVLDCVPASAAGIRLRRSASASGFGSRQSAVGSRHRHSAALFGIGVRCTPWHRHRHAAFGARHRQSAVGIGIRHPAFGIQPSAFGIRRRHRPGSRHRHLTSSFGIGDWPPMKQKIELVCGEGQESLASCLSGSIRHH